MTTTEPVMRGREAYGHLAWRDAYEHLSAVDQDKSLAAELLTGTAMLISGRLAG